MSNGHCSTCDIEARCAYQYKPCDCAGKRKFTPMHHPTQVLRRFVKMMDECDDRPFSVNELSDLADIASEARRVLEERDNQDAQ